MVAGGGGGGRGAIGREGAGVSGPLPVHPKGKDNPKGLKDIPFALQVVTSSE